MLRIVILIGILGMNSPGLLAQNFVDLKSTASKSNNSKEVIFDPSDFQIDNVVQKLGTMGIVHNPEISQSIFLVYKDTFENSGWGWRLDLAVNQRDTFFVSLTRKL